MNISNYLRAVFTTLSPLGARTITGTANQITVANGSGAAGNPTLTIASNPIIPGTGAMTVPIGTTGQDPASPTSGMVRYDSTTNKLVVWINGAKHTVDTTAV